MKTASAPAVASNTTSAAPHQNTPARVQRSEKPRANVPREYEWFGGYSFYRDQSDGQSFGGGWALSGARQGFETLAGFMLARLGKIPQGGETVDYGGRRFTVVSMAGHRIGKVKVQALESVEKPVPAQAES